MSVDSTLRHIFRSVAVLWTVCVAVGVANVWPHYPELRASVVLMIGGAMFAPMFWRASRDVAAWVRGFPFGGDGSSDPEAD